MKLACHCGNIEIEAGLPAQVTCCNCSICRRYQCLWAYYAPEEVSVKIGAGLSSTYIWGDKEIEFVRCKACGCVTHYQTLEGQSDPKIAVNIRMAVDQDVESFAIRYFDGATLL